MSKHWIQLPGGKQFWPLSAKGPLEVGDIANSLSKLPRYTGQTRYFYSVAQHAINVARVLPDHLKGWGLHHDDPEFVLNDVATPLKHRWFMWPYRRAERKIMRRIAKQEGLGWPMPEEVKIADYRMMATEIRFLFDKLHPEWEQWLAGIKPYDLPRSAFVSQLPTNYYASEFIGLANVYRGFECSSSPSRSAAPGFSLTGLTSWLSKRIKTTRPAAQ